MSDYSNELQLALELVVKKFAGIGRKRVHGGTRIPYVVHCLRVMQIGWKWGAGTQTNMLAWLAHDTCEDTNTTEAELVSIIGREATDIVLELTFDEKQMSKEEYMGSFRNKSIGALIGKVADRVANVQDFILTDPAYAKKYFQKAEPLWSVLQERSSEIAHEYGEVVERNILEAVRELREIVSEQYRPMRPFYTVLSTL